VNALAGSLELLRRPEHALARGGVWVGVLAFVPVTALAADQGGYFATSWGWAAVGLLWVAALALVLRPAIRLGTADYVLVLTWTAVAAWIALSALWSADAPQTVLEIERTLVYLSAVLAFVLVARAYSRVHMLGGVLWAIGAISLFSLATRLFPNTLRVFDPTAVNRLAQPIGYWNGLCGFVVIGIVLALGFAIHGRAPITRVAAAALLVPLVATFYFTFSKNGWIALAAGLLAAVVVDRRRLELLLLLILLAPVLVLDVWLSSRRPGLTQAHVSLQAATRDGHHLAWILVGLTAAAAAVSLAILVVGRRASVSPAARRAFTVCVVAACCALLGFVFSRYGGPATLGRHGWRSFKAAPSQAQDLNTRLLTLSGDGRYDYWRIALDDYRSHPLLGSGAGSYERYFLQHTPPNLSRVSDAHGLYVETLAELGPFGLLLVLVALATPLVVMARGKRGPLVGAAAGAYVALLAHAASDWDWELPAVILAGLVCGIALVVGERREERLRPLPSVVRAGAVGAIAAVGVFALIGLVGNAALAASRSDLAAGKLESAQTQARRAARWAPWSAAPWDALGNAQFAARDDPAARTSFEHGLSIDHDDWQLWYDLANASTGASYRVAAARSLALYPFSGLNPAERSDSP